MEPLFESSAPERVKMTGNAETPQCVRPYCIDTFGTRAQEKTLPRSKNDLNVDNDALIPCTPSDQSQRRAILWKSLHVKSASKITIKSVITYILLKAWPWLGVMFLFLTR